ncbi:hypothetical protein QX201_003928 [Fusarium graminearum]
MEDPGFIHIADNDDNEFTGITTPRSIYDKFFMSGSGSWSGSGRIRDRCSGGKLLTFGGGPWPPVNVPRFHQSFRRSPLSLETSTSPTLAYNHGYDLSDDPFCCVHLESWSQERPDTTTELACRPFRRLQFPKTQPSDKPTELVVHTPTKHITFIFRSSMTIPCHHASWSRPGIIYQLMHELFYKTKGVNSLGAATKLAIMRSLSKPVWLHVMY